MTDQSPQKAAEDWWQTALIRMEPNQIDIRGRPIADLIGTIGFVDMACITLKPGAEASGATARAIFDHGRDLLAYYKLPGWIAFVDELPRTGTQKVQKGLIFPGLDDPRNAEGAVDLRPYKKRKT